MDDVESVVELDEEFVIAEGAELGAAAATEGAAATTGEAETEGAAAIEVAADAGASEVAIEGAAEAALEDPGDAGADDPDPDNPDPDDPDEDDPAAAVLEFDEDEPPPATTLHLAPVGAVSALVPSFSTEAPGSGNNTSAESTVSQSVVGMLALNMPGKDGVVRS